MKLLFAIVFLSSTLVMTSLVHSWHYADLNQNNESANEIVGELFTEGQAGVFHFLKEGCGCSEIVTEKLLERAAREDVTETIVYIGEIGTLKERFQSQNYRTQQWQEEKLLAHHDIGGAPTLLVHDAEGKTLYKGGYTEGMVTPMKEIKDQQIITQALSGVAIKKLPTVGCAVSNSMKKSYDPLGLKELP